MGAGEDFWCSRDCFLIVRKGDLGASEYFLGAKEHFLGASKAIKSGVCKPEVPKTSTGAIGGPAKLVLPSSIGKPWSTLPFSGVRCSAVKCSEVL